MRVFWETDRLALRRFTEDVCGVVRFNAFCYAGALCSIAWADLGGAMGEVGIAHRPFNIVSMP